MPNFDELYSGKKILITGGGGFIGSNLAKKLVSFGAEVLIMDSRLSGYGYNYFNLYDIYDKINIDFTDIRDYDAIKKNIAGKNIIFNFAAQVGEGSSEKNPELDYDINVLGHKKVIDACLEQNPSVRIIFSGSRTQYGKVDNLPVSETQESTPLSPYAKNKFIGEKMYLEAYKKGLETVVFRITNPFGPRAAINNPGYCITNWFVAKVIGGEDLPIYGEGDQIRDYIYIDDLVEAMVIAGVHKDAPGKMFNLGTGIGTKFKEMAQQIIDLENNGISKLKFIEWPSAAKNREVGDFYADISKIKNILGWEPKYSLKEGLKKTIDYYKLNGKYYGLI